ncbi:radical SAM protein [Acidaminococcus intestini]|nr:radical SAM protein [Acidaminococcus intestini]
MPEVDAIIGTECYDAIGSVIDRVEKGERFVLLEAPKQYSQPKSRVLSTPQYTAYVKIAEGCSNRCSYCAIPKIRGPYRSRPYEEIVEEVKSLVHSRVRGKLSLLRKIRRSTGLIYTTNCVFPSFCVI